MKSGWCRGPLPVPRRYHNAALEPLSESPGCPERIISLRLRQEYESSNGANVIASARRLARRFVGDGLLGSSAGYPASFKPSPELRQGPNRLPPTGKIDLPTVVFSLKRKSSAGGARRRSHSSATVMVQRRYRCIVVRAGQDSRRSGWGYSAYPASLRSSSNHRQPRYRTAIAAAGELARHYFFGGTPGLRDVQAMRRGMSGRLSTPNKRSRHPGPREPSDTAVFGGRGR